MRYETNVTCNIIKLFGEKMQKLDGQMKGKSRPYKQTTDQLIAHSHTNVFNKYICTVCVCMYHNILIM